MAVAASAAMTQPVSRSGRPDPCRSSSGQLTVSNSCGQVTYQQQPLELGGHPGGVGYSVGTMIERQPRILAFAGSLRKGSFNRMLLRYAILGAREAGGDVEELGPEHLTLPLYNVDLEASGSFPEPVE